jgi:hypothetical protein
MSVLIFLISYTVFMVFFVFIALLVRPQVRGAGIMWLSAAIGPVLTIGVTVVFLRDGANAFGLLFLVPVVAAMFATCAIGFVVSWLISAHLRVAMSRDRSKTD